MPTEKKLKKFNRQLNRAEGKIAKAEYKAAKKVSKVTAKTEKRAAKAGIKLKTGYLPSVKKTLRADGKWPVPALKSKKK